MSARTWPEPKPHPVTKRADRRFDQSQLREAQKAHLVDRDYAAHYFRWGFAARFHKPGCRALEIGCGQDQPLIKVLLTRGHNFPEVVVATDLNRITKKSGIQRAHIHDEFNFVDRWRELAKEYGKHTFDVASCFEVIEHMQVKDGKELLKGVHELLRPSGTFLLSTPIYNGRHMAAAHLHEYQHDELKELVERAGFKVERQHGTFMTAQAIKRVATKEERALVEELAQFYSWDVLANFLAPKYPLASSNCCWVLRPA